MPHSDKRLNMWSVPKHQHGEETLLLDEPAAGMSAQEKY